MDPISPAPDVLESDVHGATPTQVTPTDDSERGGGPVAGKEGWA